MSDRLIFENGGAGEMGGSGRRQQVGDISRYTSCGEHCFSICILKVCIRDGRIIAVEPDDTVNPGLPREDGYVAEESIDKSMFQVRPCAKGYTKVCMIYDPNRVKYPMKRVGERGEARFERISWDEALDTIAKKLVEVKGKYGPSSIMGTGYRGGGFPLAPWFGAGVKGWGSHSTQGRAEPEIWVLGKPQLRQDFQDEGNLFKSKLIVLWGFNPTSMLSNRGTYALLRARERGIPIICIESRYTPSAEVLAHQWIPIRPTTDVAMMIAMANVWFKEDLCDKESIEKWVEPDGLRRWKAYVMGTDDNVDKTPQWAEKLCGIPAETIAAFARLYARSKPVNLIVAHSLGRQFYGENPIRAAMYLQALTGNVCIPGGTSVADTGHGFGSRNMFGRGLLPTPVVDWQRAHGKYRPPVLMVHFRWPVAVDLREKLDKGEISVDEYNHAVGNVPGNEPPNIRMGIFEMDNSLVTHPDINTNIRAFKKLDFIVVFSHHTDNPSARYADILLPQMANPFEGRDGGNPFEVGANYFVYRQKCVDPPGEIKPGAWIWVQIAKRLGIADQYSPLLANVPDDRWDEVIENLHQEAYEKWASRKEIRPLNPPNWEEFQKRPVFRWEIEEPYYAYKRELDRGENPFRGTESGKIEFYSKGLAKGPDYLAANEFPVSPNALVLQSRQPEPAKWYGGGNLPPIAQMTMGGKASYYSKDVEKYPLIMSSPHALFRTHSFLDNQPLLNEDCYRHAVWINVSDAGARG
ncbi:molybdopterin-dependent oxidoreductase, partial [Chloroflexota bacterium]